MQESGNHNFNTSETMLSARKAAKRLSCNPDYVSKLCREGKLVGVRVNGAWMVSIESIALFEKAREEAKIVRAQELSKLRKQENKFYKAVEEKVSSKDEITKGVKELFTIRRVGAAVGIMLLFAAFTSAAGSISGSAKPQDMSASLAQINSPFFGNHPFAVTISGVSSGQNIFGALLSMFAPKAPTVAQTATSTTPVADAKPPVVTTPIAAGTTTNTTIVKNTYPIVERTVEHTTTVSGITQEQLDEKISELNNSIRALLFSTIGSLPSSGGITNTIALTQHIDQLSGTILTNVVVHGVSGLTDADIPDDITVNTSSLTVNSTSTLSGITLAGTDCSLFNNGGKLTTDALGNVVCADDFGATGGVGAPGGANGTVQYNDAGGFGGSAGFAFNKVSGVLTVPQLFVTGSTTLAGVTIANSTTTNATSTNLFASNAKISNIVLGSLNGPLQAVNGAVSATSTLSVAFGGTGISTYPAYGQVLVGNSAGGYTLTSTSSLGIASAVWGNITGSIANQTDLQTALNLKLSTTSLDSVDKGYFFSTTSASYFLAQNAVSGFSTTSANYWKSVSDFFSTTSANYLLSTIDKGYFFSTTSANFAANTLINASSTIPHVGGSSFGDVLTWSGTAWTARATSTLGLGGSGGGSVTSVDASGGTTGLAFTGGPITSSGSLTLSGTLNVANGGTGSTTLTGLLKGNGTGGVLSAVPGVDYLASNAGDWTGTFDGLEGAYYLANSFSTSSAQYFLALNQGNAFSTTSVDYWKTVNNFFSTTSAAYFLAQNQGAAFSTTSANNFISNIDKGFFFSTTSAGYFLSQNSNSSSFPFTPTSAFGVAANSTSTLIGFINGIYSLASSTIGNGNQNGGLTINGGATTTGTLAVLGTGTSTIAGGVAVTGSIVPTVDNTYSLGDPTHYFKDLYLGAHSLYVNGQQVVSTNGSNDVVVSSSPNENLILQTSGTANIEFNPTGGTINFKNTVNISAGKSIVTTDLSALPVPNGVAAGNITISGHTITANDTNGGISITPNGTGNTYVTNNNFGVGTTNPQARLDVMGTASTSNLYVANGATTTSLAIANVASSLLKTLSNGAVVAAQAGTDYITSANLAAWPFAPSTYGSTASNATSTLIGFTGGLYATASSTIGSGAQNGGLTIKGGATTTGSSFIAGSLAVNGSITTNITGSVQCLRVGSNGVITGTGSDCGSGGGGSGTFLGLSDVPGAYIANQVYYTNSTADAVTASNNFTFDGTTLTAPTISASTLAISGSSTFGTVVAGIWHGTAVADAYVADNLTISGGTINNTPIGATTPSTGTFTSATTTNATTTNLAITGIAGALIKTLASGAVVPAVAGVDYQPAGNYATFTYPFPNNATSTTLTFNNGLVSVGSTTINGNATTTGNVAIGGTAKIGTLNGVLYGINGTVGTVATNTLGLLASSSLSATGPLSYNVATGAFSISQSGNATDGYLSSADWNSFNARLSTSSLALFDKGYFFSTTSVDYWRTQNDFFSTTSVNYWKTVTDLFSTTSAAYFLAQNQGAAFSTTSATAFLNAFDKGYFFSTTSALAWKAANDFFSTTSSNYLLSTIDKGYFFSTTSTDYYISQANISAFSTTSAIYFVNASTTIPKTYTSNTFAAAQTFNGGVTIGSLSGLLNASNGVVGTIATNTLGLLASSSLSATAPLSYNQATGNFSITQAGLAQNGYLSSTDFNTFNNKISSTSLSGSTGISYNSSTGVITNTGVTSLAAGAGISVSASTGTVTITNTIGYAFPSNATSTSIAFNGGLTAANILTTGSTTLQNFTANNATTSQATTTNLAVTGVSNALLKTLSSGAVVAAIAGTDYLTAANVFAYPFPNNATSTTLTFNAGLVSVGSTTINGSATTTGSLAVFGSTTVSSVLNIGGAVNANGALAVGGNTTLRAATSTSFAITGLVSGAGQCLTVDLSGNVTTQSCTAGAATPFVFLPNYATPTAATSTPLWVQNGIFASSTSHFANADFINSTSTNATTTNLFASAFAATNATLAGLTLGAGNGPLIAASGAVSAASFVPVSYGGTGLTSGPSFGQLLVGNSSGGYTLSATSTLGINFADVRGAATDAQINDALTISNGSINASPIGATSASTAVFTNSTSTNATTSTLYINGTIAGAGLTSCSTSVDKLLWDATTRQFFCGTDQAGGASGSDFNFTYFNGSGVRLATSSNQVLFGNAGHTSTSTLSKLEVWGGATIDSLAVTDATTTSLSVGGQATVAGRFGVGTTSPSANLAVSGGNILQVAAGNPTLANSTATSNHTMASFVSGNFAYVADLEGGLKIYDVTNPKSPVLAGTYASISSANDVVVAGKYAYVADVNTGLQIIDISKPSAPVLAGTYGTAGLTYSVAVSGKYAYITDYSNHLMRVIDISNPAAPFMAGSYNTTGNPNGVTVSGKYAFITDEIPGVYIVDISNPTAPSLVTTYTTLADFPKDVFVSGRYAYVADQGSGLYILNIANPASPTLVGRYDPGSTGSYNGVQVAGGLAYLADDTGALTVVNVANPASPTLVGSYSSGDSGQSVFVAGKYAYLAANANGLRVVDINGADLPSASIGALAANLLNVSDTLTVGGDIYTQGGITSGLGGIFTRGGLSVLGTTTLSNALIVNASTTLNGQLTVAGSTTLQNFTGRNATTTNATTTTFAITGVASSLLKTLANGSVVAAVAGVDYATAGASAFTYTTNYGTLTAATSSILFAQNGIFASSTSHFANADFINSTSTNATTTNLAITGVTSSLLKTLSNGAVVAAVAGTDYATVAQIGSAYPFPNNATSTTLTFNSGIVSVGSTTINGNATTTGVLNVFGGLTVGTTTNGGALTIQQTANNVNGGFRIYKNTSTISWNQYIDNNNSLRFNYTGTDLGVFTQVGAFGIGTTTASLPGLLTVAATSSASNLPLFTLQGPTPSGFATSTLFQVAANGSTTLYQIPSSLLKTDSNGVIVAAVAGTDYALPSAITSAYPFPNNATSTTLTFNAGLVSVGSTTINGSATTTGSLAVFGSTTISSILNVGGAVNANGALTVAGNTSLQQATSTSLAITNIASGNILKTSTGGAVVAAVAGTDFTTPAGVAASIAAAYPFPSNATSTSIAFNGGLTATNILTTGSTTLQNFTANNATTSQATTTNLAITGISSSLLKTLSNGAVVGATAGVDYATVAQIASAFPFTPGTNFGVAVNSTSTPINFVNGIFASTTSRFAGINTISATTTSLAIGNLNGLLYGTNGVVGTVATNTLGLLASSSLSATGPLSYNVATGAFSISQSGASTDGYLSSADWNSFNARLSTSSLALFDKGYFFSTTSVAYWKSVTDLFSTTSAAYFLSVNQGASFSTTSATAFINTYDKGFFFSTTSALAWKAANDFFSTTSASYFLSVNQGAAFSTTSSNVAVNTFINASTTIPKTYTANTFTAAQIFNGGVTIGSLNGLVGANNGSLYQIATSTSFVTSLAAGNGISLSNTTGAVTITNTIGYPFVGNATTTNLAFNGGATFAGATSTALAVTGSTTISSILNVGGAINANGGVVGTLTGNASTATALQTGRTINGVTFDGTANIVITAASSTLLANSNTFTGTNTFTSTIQGNISGNAATVTTNANLSGVVTSVGNTTSFGSFTSATLATALSDETGSGAAVFGTNASLTGATLASTTLTGNVYAAGATTTNLAISSVASSLLKTLSNGAVVAAVAGTDYQAAGNYATFGYLFPNNATSTTLTFNAGLLSVGSTTINGNLNIIGNSTSTNATSTNLFATLGRFNTLAVSGGALDFSAAAATTTLINNNPYAFTFATSSTGKPLFRIDTTSGSENVAIGSSGTDVTIGDVGAGANLVFEENSTIKGQTGGRTLTFGGTGDKINFAVNTGFGSSTPAQTLSVQGGALISGNVYAANITATGTATTSNLAVTSVTSSLLKTNALGQLVAAVSGTDYATPANIASAFPFTAGASTFGLAANSTSTAILFTNSISASSTSHFAGISTLSATTSVLSVTSSTTIAGQLNAVGGATLGSLSAGATTLSSLTLGSFSGLIGSNNGVTYQIATSTNFVTSLTAGNGISVSAATGAINIANTIGYPFTPFAGTSATTSVLFPAGLMSGTSTIGAFNATSSLTIANLNGLLKATNGLVSAATAGTDYATPANIAAAYPFPNNATTTNIAFNGGISTTYASTTQISSLSTSYFATSGGFVGVGTSTPGQLLSVAGNIYASNNGFLSTTAAGSSQTISNFLNNFNNNTGLALRKTAAGTGDYLVAEDSSLSTLLVLKSSGNFGLGTTSPTQTLSVQGGALISGNLFGSNITATGTITGTNGSFTTATSTNLAVTSVTSSLLKTNALGQLVAAVAGIDYAAAGAGAYPFAGAGNSTSTLTQFNAGLTAYASSTIGNGTQVGGLTINGGATTTGNLLSLGSISVNNAQYFQAQRNNGGAYIQVLGFDSGSDTLNIKGGASGSSAIIRFRNSGNNELGVFTGLGNFGLGTSSPWGKLSINNSTNDTAGQPLFVVASSTASATTTLFQISNTGAVVATNGGTDYGYTIVNTASSQDFFKGVTSGGVWAYEVGLDSSNNGYLNLRQGGGATTVDIETGGVTYFNGGNVGIGSTTPSTNFAVQGNSLTSGTSTAGNLAATSTLTIGGLAASAGQCLTTNANGLVIAQSCSTGSAAFPFTASTFGSTASNATSTLIGFNSGLYALASSTIGNGSQTGGLTISGGATTTGNAYFAGNVGIGAISSAYKFNVTGGAFSFQNNNSESRLVSDASNTFLYTNTSANNYAELGAYDTESGALPLILQRGGGNVGIGTTSPGRPISIYNANAQIEFTSASAPNTTWQVGAPGDNTFRITEAGINDWLRITPTSGNVGITSNLGIGTTTPLANLSISSLQSGWVGLNGYSNNLSNGFYEDFYSASTTLPNGGKAGGFTLNDTTHFQGAGLYFKSYNSNFPIYFQTTPSSGGNPITRVTIDPTGNVGIGSTTPSTNFAVQGNSLTSGTSTAGNLAATSTLTIGGLAASAGQCLTTNANGLVIAQSCSTGSAAFPFTPTAFGNATSTLLQFNAGLIALASSTIGNGSQTGGLTINGGATTTGNAYFAGNLNVGSNNQEGQVVFTSPGSGTLFVAEANDGSNWFTIENGGTIRFNAQGGTTQVGGATNTNGRLNIGSLTTSKSALTLGGIAGQTENILEINDLSTVDRGGNYFLVGATGNVGVGTTTPYAKLSINNSTNDPAGQALFAIASSTASATTTVFSVSNTGQVAVVGGNNNLETVLLDLRSNFAGGGTGSSIRLTNTNIPGSARGVEIASVRQSDASNDFVVRGGTAAGAFAEYFRILGASGNVGIGTSTPAALLDINGTGANTDFRITRSGSSNFAFLRAPNGTPFEANIGYNATNVINFNASGVQIGTSTAMYSKFGVWGAGTGTGQLFELTNNASTTVARFLDNGTGYFAGNIGIGTTTPSALFAVQGDSLTSGTSTVGNLLATSTLTVKGLAASAGQCLTVNGNGLVIAQSCSAGSAAFPYTPSTFGSTAANATSTLIKFNNGIASLASSTIGSGSQTGGLTVLGGATTTGNAYFNGNIGIGTQAPTDKLTIVGGQVSIFNTGNTIVGSDSGKAIEIKANSAGASPYIDLADQGAEDFDFRVISRSDLNQFQIFSSTTANAFVINGNGNVGIGTTNPSTNFVVQGTNNMTALFQSSNTTGTGLALNNTSAGASQFEFFSTGSANGSGVGNFGVYNDTLDQAIVTFLGTTGTMKLPANAVLQWGNDAQYTGTIDTGLSRLSSGIVAIGTGVVGNASGTLALAKIGIGTTTPVSVLSFNASTTATGGINFGNDTTLYRSGAFGLKTDADFFAGGSILSNTGNANQIKLSNSGHLQFSNLTDTDLYRDSALVLRTNASFLVDGNLGVGTTTPSVTLSVQGNALISGTTTAGNLVATSTLTVKGLAASAGQCLTVNSAGLVVAQSCGGAAAAFPFTPTTTFGSAANATSTLIGFTSGIYALASSTIGNGSQTGGLTVSGNATTTGNAYFNGNVGISVRAPAYALDVSGQQRIAGPGGVVGAIGDTTYALSLQNNTNSTWLEILNNTGAGKGAFFGVSNSNTTGAFELWNYGGSSIDFFTSTSVSSGTNRLHIDPNGNIGLGTTTPFAKLSIDASNLGSEPAFVIGSTTSTLFSVTNAGAVGIGTSSPARGLLGIQAVGTADAELSLYSAAPSGHIWSLQSNGTSANRGGNFEIVDRTSSNSRLTIASTTGYIGLGSATNPDAILSIFKGDGGALDMQHLRDSADGTDLVTYYDGNNFQFRSEVGGSGNDYLTFQESSGNVGVGTSTPTAKFTVAGSYAIGSSIPTTWAQINSGKTGVVNGNRSFYFDIFSSPYFGAEFSTFKYDDSSSFPMIFQANGGNIGVGNAATSPGSKISSYGNASIGTSYYGTAAPANGLLVQGTTGIGTSSPWARLAVDTTSLGNIPAFAVGSSTKTSFVVNQNGVVGIGTTTNATTTILVVQGQLGSQRSVAAFSNAAGTCYISPNSAGISCSSDIRLKKNVSSLPSALNSVLSLNAVNFNWNVEATGTPAHVGFIAQQIEQVIPDLVQTDDNGMKSVNYGGLTPYLVSAIQELATSSVRIKSGVIDLSMGSSTATTTISIGQTTFAIATSSTSTPIISISSGTATTSAAIAISGALLLNGVDVGAAIASSSATTTPAALVAGPFAQASQLVKDALTNAAAAIASVAQNGIRELGSAVHASLAVVDTLVSQTITANVINADTVNTNTLCLNGLCVTRQELENLLGGQGGAQASAPVTTPSNDTGSASSTNATSTESTPEPTPDTTADTQTGSSTPAVSDNSSSTPPVSDSASASDTSATTASTTTQS